jgi:hypothetical protein
MSIPRRPVVALCAATLIAAMAVLASAAPAGQPDKTPSPAFGLASKCPSATCANGQPGAFPPPFQVTMTATGDGQIDWGGVIFSRAGTP